MSGEGESEADPLPARKVIWGNLGARLVSGIAFAVICFIPFYFGGIWWGVFVALLGARMIWEWVRMSDLNASMFAYLFPILGLWISLILYRHDPKFAAISVVIFAALAIIERTRRGRPLRAGFGFLYITVPSLFIIFLRGSGAGPDAPGFSLLLAIIMVVIAADTGAYFGGSYFKGPKLAPKISPKKTWSGFICGTIFGMLVGGLVMQYLSGAFWMGVFWAIPTVFLSVIGDFVESWLKRRMMVKDAGGVLPGHGGVLDRLDSLMLVVVVLGVLLALNPGVWPL